MTAANEIDALARWYHAMYIKDKGLKTNQLKPIAADLKVNIPTVQEGKQAGYRKDGVMHILRDRLMLESIL